MYLLPRDATPGPEHGLDAQLVFLLDQAAQVVRQQFAQHLVDHPDTRQGAAHNAAKYTTTGKMWHVLDAAHAVRVLAARSGTSIFQVHLLRCIFGNPFRTVSTDPVWLTSTVLALANLQRYPSSEVVGGAYLRYSGFVTALDLGRYTLASVLPSLAEAVGMDAQPISSVQESGLTLNEPSKDKAVEGEKRAQVDLICDIFGNPFRAVTVDPSWLTSTVLALATGIYQERAFDRMPILADALQDAGCDNEDVLDHCRGEGPHVRGCWVCDLVLGKE